MISSTKKFIFVHIPRVAGSSIEETLATYSDYEIGIRKDKSKPFSNRHRSIRDFEKSINLAEYFKFSLVRNPWDRMVSLYFWGKQLTKKVKFNTRSWPQNSFKDWLKSDVWKVGIKEYGKYYIPPLGQTQLSWLIRANGELGVDYIGQFEHINKSWFKICNEIGLEFDTLKHSHATKREHYTYYYDKECEDLVREHFEEDILAFEYVYG